MRTPFVMALLLAWAALLAPIGAYADPIAFELAVDGEYLTVTQRGDGIAFYPQVYFLDAHGNWVALSASPRISQLDKDEAMRFDWRPASNANPSGVLQVRYFDRAGSGFGQLGFLTDWPGLTAPFQTRIENGRLRIEHVGNDVSTTWVLWGARDDERNHRFGDALPPLPPVRLQWGNPSDSDSARPLHKAIGLPAAAGNISLLHELVSADGAMRYAVQHLPPAPEAAPPHHPIWIDSGKWAYAVSVLFLLIALGMIVRHRDVEGHL